MTDAEGRMQAGYIAAGQSAARHERWLTDQRAQPVVTKNRNAKCERGGGRLRGKAPWGQKIRLSRWSCVQKIAL